MELLSVVVSGTLAITVTVISSVLVLGRDDRHGQLPRSLHTGSRRIFFVSRVTVLWSGYVRFDNDGDGIRNGLPQVGKYVP